MKFFFSLLYVFNTYAFEAVVIHYQTNINQAEVAKKILSHTFNFPDELIIIKKAKCLIDENIMLQICAKDDGEYEVVRMNEYYVKNYFAEFIKRKEVSYEQ